VDGWRRISYEMRLRGSAVSDVMATVQLAQPAGSASICQRPLLADQEPWPFLGSTQHTDTVHKYVCRRFSLDG